MALTDAEKKAGRWWRAKCAAELSGLNALAVTCPPYIPWYRHECVPSDRAVQSGTWAMPLRQHYWTSPEIWVCYCSTYEALVPGVFPHRDCDGGVVAAAEGKFAFIFRSGECTRQCGLKVVSINGRFVLAADNPPEKGAVVAAK